MHTWLLDLIVFVVVVAVFSIALGLGKGSLTGFKGGTSWQVF
jgi:hypothetical protein